MTARPTQEPSFLQSPEWEFFERSLGRATWRARGALVVRRDLPFGLNYLYCPRPSIGLRDEGLGMRMLDAVAEIAKERKSIFLKIDPLVCLQATTYLPIGQAGNLQPAIPIQPRETLILDIAQRSEDELLAAMHEKTRYNIRLAERKGVEVAAGIAGEAETSDLFWGLLAKTAARDGFRTHPKGYYEKLAAVRSDAFSNEFFLACYRDTVVAGALINFYGNTATYLHGAWSGEYREVMAPHLLHWRIIQEAMRRGCGHYDWWGIDERRWPGVTRFKRGFGGREVAYPRSVNMVYRRVWYTLYAAAKRGKS